MPTKFFGYPAIKAESGHISVNTKTAERMTGQSGIGQSSLAGYMTRFEPIVGVVYWLSRGDKGRYFIHNEDGELLKLK